MYSFTKPKKKPIFKEDTKLWLIFIGVSLILYIGFAMFLEIKALLYNKDINKFNNQIANLNKELITISKEKEFIFTQKALYENIMVKNELMKNSIKNLLDLIPDPITLNSIYFDKNRLIIYGITPTKEIYNMLMLPPLESIFTQTKTYFYQMPNGWYKFKSENYLKDSQ
ncbi:MAG: hypothetical protein ABGX26_00595 [Nautiliaceae bacterium]|jgi:hypothetical protein